MRSFVASVLIISLLCGGALGIALFEGGRLAQIENIVDALSDECNISDKISTIREKWSRLRRIMQLTVRESTLGETDRLISKLRYFADSGDRAQYLIARDSLRDQIAALKRINIPYLFDSVLT